MVDTARRAVKAARYDLPVLYCARMLPGLAQQVLQGAKSPLSRTRLKALQLILAELYELLYGSRSCGLLDDVGLLKPFASICLDAIDSARGDSGREQWGVRRSWLEKSVALDILVGISVHRHVSSRVTADSPATLLDTLSPRVIKCSIILLQDSFAPQRASDSACALLLSLLDAQQGNARGSHHQGLNPSHGEGNLLNDQGQVHAPALQDMLTADDWTIIAAVAVKLLNWPSTGSSTGELWPIPVGPTRILDLLRFGCHHFECCRAHIQAQFPLDVCSYLLAPASHYYAQDGMDPGARRCNFRTADGERTVA